MFNKKRIKELEVQLESALELMDQQDKLLTQKDDLIADLLKTIREKKENDIKQLALFAKEHYIDSIEYGDVKIVRSMHLMPESDDDKKKKTAQDLADLVSWST